MDRPAMAGWRHQHDGRAGRFIATGQRLSALPGSSDNSGQALILVTLRRHEPRREALERALRKLPQAQIARTPGVAPSTVVDHLRKAYRVLDLHSAQALRALPDRRIAAAAAA